MKNMSTLYQHLRSELVPPRVKTMAAAWQVWDSVQDGVGDTIHIDYDGEYGSAECLYTEYLYTVYSRTILGEAPEIVQFLDMYYTQLRCIIRN